MMAMAARTGKAAIPDRYLCSHCHYLLVEPKFLVCGHQFCSVCLEKVLKAEPARCTVANCGQIVTKEGIYPNIPMESELERFTEIVCRNQSNGCVWHGDYRGYKDHLRVCQHSLFQCECCSTTFNQRLAYEQHYLLCPKAPVSCPLSQFGCDAQIPREALQSHVTSSSIEHLRIIANALQTEPSADASKSTHSHPDLSALKTELHRLVQTHDELRSEQQSQQNLLARHERDVNRALVNSQLNKGEICTLEKKLPSLRSSNHNDGTYVWIIENIQDLFRNAKNATQPVHLTSPAFYTSNDGYKLSLKLYLNGDKSARDTYLSLYVTLRRNDYDALLHWPFTYPITLCLFDQSHKRDHVVRTLTPDTSSKCFQRPEMDSNVSAGIPEFCPLWKVFSKDFGYVRNDHMYIKACVDFHVLPAQVWTAWAQLQAAGLPSHIQYIKLKESLDEATQ